MGYEFEGQSVGWKWHSPQVRKGLSESPGNHHCSGSGVPWEGEGLAAAAAAAEQTHFCEQGLVVGGAWHWLHLHLAGTET